MREMRRALDRVRCNDSVPLALSSEAYAPSSVPVYQFARISSLKWAVSGGSLSVSRPQRVYAPTNRSELHTRLLVRNALSVAFSHVFRAFS